ncbi:MAG TPA: hypothetical protein ENJ39_05305 [Flammeovirgaceae bacterium]|nr:hypothetical protein [Flammeovirgaceae bacterium]
MNMFKSVLHFGILVWLGLVLSSCVVSKKQFDELLTEKVKLEGELNNLQSKTALLEEQLDSLTAALQDREADNQRLQRELQKKTSRLDSLLAEHDRLQQYYNNAINNSSRLNRDMQEQHNRLLALQKTLADAEYRNNLLADSLAAREQKVAELEQVLQQTQQAITDLKNLVNQALTGFTSDELTVEQKNGRIYVSLSEKLLFRSGSIEVDPKGKKALIKLAKALRDADHIQIMVEGHTDNVPITGKSRYMQDNWDLSVMRATSIVKILTANGVDPKLLIAAGRGEYLPVAPNDSPQNRQLNRRTEIILTPDLRTLYQVLGKEN